MKQARVHTPDARRRPSLVLEHIGERWENGARPRHRLHAFGGVDIQAAAGPLTGRAVQRHRIALLALLTTTRRPSRSRDQLVFLLWPNADIERGRRLLSDSIYRINVGLDGSVLGGTHEDVRLNRACLASDVADLEASADAGDWDAVMRLYRGPFLDGFYLPGAPEFDRWLEGERAHYLRIAARACEALAVDAGSRRRLTESVEWWTRLATLVPDDSRIAVELMRALDSAGHRAGALRHAQRHAEFLGEVGIDPDPSVLALVRQLRPRSSTHQSARNPALGSAREARHAGAALAASDTISIRKPTTA